MPVHVQAPLDVVIQEALLCCDADAVHNMMSAALCHCVKITCCKVQRSHGSGCEQRGTALILALGCIAVHLCGTSINGSYVLWYMLQINMCCMVASIIVASLCLHPYILYLFSRHMWHVLGGMEACFAACAWSSYGNATLCLALGLLRIIIFLSGCCEHVSGAVYMAV